MKPAYLVALSGLLLLIGHAQASSTYRCNSSLVSVGASTSEVRSKCGEPADAAITGLKETVDDRGFRQEVQVEEWTYGPTNGMYHHLRFEGNRLSDIESQRGR
ncbi:DUF2845 domain-containing protein [Stutzerimonas marianensis]|uniref:DUF2845 domain-containing protein n=1 Tax=Stutzerimonas marianensis TaxID=2929513 RepID=A0A9X1W3A6_9GAMM|nr:DUF2845 domain-containing protein [Pseudomonas marianensis]MCJ0973902.1 DUF2845 domain-containing protein [Pseudomonas marianensis]